jgi:hypothetical protein
MAHPSERRSGKLIGSLTPQRGRVNRNRPNINACSGFMEAGKMAPRDFPRCGSPGHHRRMPTG